MFTTKKIALIGAAQVCAVTVFAYSDVTVVSSSLWFEDQNGVDMYDGALPEGSLDLFGELGHVSWSGTGGEYVSYEASGGDYYGVTDIGDPWYSEYWEEMQYTFSDMTMTFLVTEEVQLVGWGDLGFKLSDENGTSDAAALNDISGGAILTSGVYTIRVSDFGFGQSGGYSNNYYESTEEGDFWDYSWATSYDYYGGFSFAAVPAPGALGFLALAGVRTRRRR